LIINRLFERHPLSTNFLIYLLIKILVFLITISLLTSVNVHTKALCQNGIENHTASSYMPIVMNIDQSIISDGYLEIAETIIYVNIVNTITPNGTSCEAYETLNDLPTSLIELYNEEYDRLYSDAIRLLSATARFNCHSYAWYSQSYSNIYWMNDPKDYYSDYDKSYEIVSSPRVGDIICYYDNNGTQTESDDINLHSGIIVGLSGEASNGVCGTSNMYIVKSKWGPAGLYQHKGDDCPYTSSHNGFADYVRYYRPRTCESISLSNPLTNTTQNIQRNYSVTQYYDNTTNYALYDLNVTYNKNYSFEVSATNLLDVRLYDEHMQLISINNTNVLSNSTYNVNFSNTLETKHYYLRVAFSGNTNGIISTKIINTHIHNYNNYTWINYARHQLECSCGATHLEIHISDGIPISPGSPYCHCEKCGGLTLTAINSPGPTNEYIIDEYYDIEIIIMPLSLLNNDEYWIE